MSAKGCKFTSGGIIRDRRLEVKIYPHKPRIEAIVISDNPQNPPLALKIWTLDEEGITELCTCAKPCKYNEALIKPALPQHIDAQMHQEIGRFRNKFGIRNDKVTISMVNVPSQPFLFDSLDNFKLNGAWKNKSLIHQIRKRFDAIPEDEDNEDGILLYEELIKRAKQHITKKQFTKAENILKEAIRTLPESAEAYYELGKLYKVQERLKEAEKTVNIALSYIRKMSTTIDLSLYNLLYKLAEEELIDIKNLREKKKQQKEDNIWRQIEKKDIEQPKSQYQPKVIVSIQFDDSNQQILTAIANEQLDEPRFFNLLVHAQRISLFQSFEQLLCLESVNIEHYQYQIETARKVLRRFAGRAILADEVGLGKTIEAGLVLKEYFIRGLVSKVLILTVPSLVSQWQEEMETKFDLKFITTDSSEFDTKDTNFWAKHDLIIASLHTAKRENHRQAIHQLEYDMLIIDEAHHLKSKSTISWQFVNDIKKKFVLLLTATPVQNNLEELYNMITILKPGQLKTLSTFKRNFVTRGNPKKPRNKQRLRELLAEVMIRNTRAQADIRIPKRHAKTIKIQLQQPEMDIYHHVSDFIRGEYCSLNLNNNSLNKFLLMMLQREIGSSVMAVIPTLKKLIENPNLNDTQRKRFSELYKEAYEVNESTKINALRHILNSINGEKCIIFTQFLETQKLIHQYLHQEGIPTSIFNGRMSSTDKNLSIKEFQDENQVLISTEAGGEGRNLQFCHIMLNYDLPWNPMRIEQRVGRICRVGQKKETYIFNLSSQNTIESYILAILDEKINMFELVLGEMDMILGNLDDDKDFEETIMDIWTRVTSKDELDKKMQEFGNLLQSAKQSYLSTKELDAALFGEDYEVE
ncbi:MAG: SNF2-related protein [bacterium]